MWILVYQSWKLHPKVLTLPVYLLPSDKNTNEVFSDFPRCGDMSLLCSYTFCISLSMQLHSVKIALCIENPSLEYDPWLRNMSD